MTQAHDPHDASDVTLQRRTFRYEAQSPDGHALAGTIEADTADEARHSLSDMGVRLVEFEMQDETAARSRPLHGGHFAAFNQQLAQLTAAGLPVERGLRLIARDMNNPRLAQTVNDVATELEQGASLPEAFDRHRQKFPRLYGRLVDAGVRAIQLPAVLFNLGQHLELIQRLHATLWRAAAYPIVVLAGIVAVMVFLGVVIVPGFRDVFRDFDMQLPVQTEFVFAVSEWMPAIAVLVVVLLVGGVMGWKLLTWNGRAQAVSDQFFMPWPLLGPVLRANLVARWCDAVRLGVQAGMDLPAALELAGEAVNSPLVRRDVRALRETLEAGQPLDEHPRLAVIPATVPAAIHLASQRHDLAEMMENLARMYQQQAELRLTTLQITLTPLLLVVLALIIGTVVSAMFLPLIQLMQSVM
ncbi:type II secretion system F family protein [Phycisphaerales bacterium AB-hyl4]|uniref:Type II secretion system F family protein n=1 Tax=Natronomicrosphaera hydrolytica TaxID=3242702 RepID=A0ABV4UB74_9BACT